MRISDSQVTDLLNAALDVALDPTPAAYRSRHRTGKTVYRTRLKRLLGLLGELDLNPDNTEQVRLRLQAIARCEADEGSAW